MFPVSLRVFSPEDDGETNKLPKTVLVLLGSESTLHHSAGAYNTPLAVFQCFVTGTAHEMKAVESLRLAHVRESPQFLASIAEQDSHVPRKMLLLIPLCERVVTRHFH
jgi:hypothetical protein